MTCRQPIDQRKRDLALIHIGAAQVGMDRDLYLAMLFAVAGVSSAAELDADGRAAVLTHLRRLGFRPTSRRRTGSDDWRQPRISKIWRLWLLLADAGVVVDRSDRALARFAFRLTRKASLAWASSTDLNRVIEALKDWCARERVAIE